MADETEPFEFGAEFFDIRDVIARIEYLRGQREEAEAEASDGHAAFYFGADEREELAKLESIIEDSRGQGGDHEWNGDWFPVTFHREDKFEDYARELAEDIHGDALRDTQWPFQHIDWEAATDALRMDYTTISIEGVDYLFR